MENNGKYRGLSNDFIEAWNESKLKNFYEKHKDELYIGIRAGYINLYYKGASISKIEYSPRKKEFHYEIANRYLDIDNKKGRQQITFDDLEYNYEKIKENVNIIQTDEKIAQQLIVQSINNNNLEWQCIDMEYAKNKQNGRFDIIAVTRQKPYKTALIELKYGSKAIGGSNGICKHAEDFLLFVDENRFESHLKKEICYVMNNYRSFVSSSHPKISVEDFSDKAHICFMILANDQNNNLKKQTERYLFEHATKASTNSFQKRIREKGDEDKLEKFEPIFLFSDVRLAKNRDEFNSNEFKFDKYKMNIDMGTKELDKI